MALAFTTLMSCSDDNEVDLSNRKFVRIDQSAVYVELSLIHISEPTRP